MSCSIRKEMNFAGGEIIHPADQRNFPFVNHFAKNRATLTDLLHDQAHIRFGNLLDETVVLRVAWLISIGNRGHRWFDPVEQPGKMPQFNAVDRALDGAAVGVAYDCN